MSLPIEQIQHKIVSLREAVHAVKRFRLKSEPVVFTNGVFDLLHTGHIHSLAAARAMGKRLLVGLNSDVSVRRLKGPSRPVQDEGSRALVLAALALVDYVIIFEEDTPLELIRALMPDVLVKGGDYTVEQIAGAPEVIANGGRVAIVPIVSGFSTTQTIRKMSDE